VDLRLEEIGYPQRGQPVAGVPTRNLFADWDSRYNVVGTPIGSWTYEINARVLSAAGTQRPSLVAADANFNGLPSLLFNGTTNVLISTLAAANWAFLDRYAGSTKAVVFRYVTHTAAAALVGTRASAGGTLYRSLTAQTPTLAFRASLMNGTQIQAENLAKATGVTYWAISSYSSANLTLKMSGSLPQASSPAGTDSAGAPDSTLTVGARPTTFFSNVNIARLLIWDRRLGDSEELALSQYLTRLYGAQP